MSEAQTTEDKGLDVADKPTARVWLAEISKAKANYGEWHKRGDRVITRYKDENNEREMITSTRGRKMAILWANVETEKPALFNQRPVPNISRRNKDSADKVGKTASMVLEKCVNASLGAQTGLDTFESIVKDVVQDLLLPGQGLAIEEYKAETTAAEVTSQQSITRYLHWKDWLTNTCRIWSEVWFFAYRVYLTKDEVAKRFDEKVAEAVPYSTRPSVQGKTTTSDTADDKAEIWTIWSKRHNRIFIVATGYGDALLDEMDPPVQFGGFWPFARPVQATVANDTIIPTPDFAMYQDQADIIDVLTNRIYKLSEALRLRGLYPGDMDSIKQLMTSTNDTEMIPIENWAMLSERGGADGLVVWFPLKDVAAALVACFEALDKQMTMLYEISGKSDIMRGSTDPNETMGAQKLKSQYGSLRLRDRQRDIQRFIRDMIQLKAEIIAEHFNQQTLAQMSGVQLLTNQQKQMVVQAQQAMQAYAQQAEQIKAAGGQPPPPPSIPQPPPAMLKAAEEPTWEEVIQLLRNDKLRGFTIDIETDSTIEPDQQAEQEKAVQFIGAVSQFLEMAGPVLQGAPQAADMLGQLLMFGVRRFKISEPVESSIEKFTEMVAQSANQPKPPPPEVQAEQARMEADKAVNASKVQSAQQIEAMKQQTAQIEANFEAQLAQMQAAFEERLKTLEYGLKREQMDLEREKMDHERERMAHEKVTMQVETANKRMEGEQKAQQAENESTGNVGEGLKSLGEGLHAVAKAHLSARKITKGPDGYRSEVAE